MTDFAAIFQEATDAANKAADEMLEKIGGDRYACGFAWVTIKPARGPLITWLKKQIDAAVDKAVAETPNDDRVARYARQRAESTYGSRRDYGGGGWEIWNPTHFNGQNIDIKEAGASAFAKVLRDHGFNCYSGSRLD